MSRLHIFLIILLYLSLVSTGQIDTLNKRGVNGGKIGYWKVYLNEKARLTKDSSKACFFGYQYYLNGEKIGAAFGKTPRLKNTTYSGVLPKMGSPILINGTFNSHARFSRKYIEEIYKDGEAQFLRAFTYKTRDKNKIDSSRVISEQVDCTTKYQELKFTYLVTVYTERHCSIVYWFRNGEKGWKLYRVT